MRKLDPHQFAAMLLLEVCEHRLGLQRHGMCDDTCTVAEKHPESFKHRRVQTAANEDGVRPVEANETLWDIGAGSGSISIEWALAGGRAIAIEAREDRAANIRTNAATFGLAHRIKAIARRAPDILDELEKPDAVFFGGGFNMVMFDRVWALLPAHARVVAHSVTLETETLLTDLHARHGGTLMRIEIAQAAPLGGFRSWEASRQVVQWSVVKGAAA